MQAWIIIYCNAADEILVFPKTRKLFEFSVFEQN